MTSWRERLKGLRDRLLGRRTSDSSPTDGAAGKSTYASDRPSTGTPSRTRTLRPTADPVPLLSNTPAKPPSTRTSQSRPTTPQRQSPVALNLGIDFGSSFTKVCYRDVGTEESGVVGIGTGGSLLPSVVVVSSTGRLYLSDAAKRVKSAVQVRYLKMRLAGVPIGDALPHVAGHDLNAESSVKALSAWFLASVIVRSQVWLAAKQADRLKGRSALWSANVGVPVEHYDSAALATFEETLGVAWLWSRDGIPATLEEAVSGYAETKARLGVEVTDFHAVPEIAAAIQSFVTSREAIEGIYVYFDIGGGTVDGVAFNYVNRGGDRRINFYSGKVASLGLAAISAELGEPADAVDAETFQRLMSSCAPEQAQKLIHKIRRVVGEVIMTAKMKDGRNWQVEGIQSADYERKFIGRMSPSRMKPLIVFVGGGGSRSTWYTDALASTYTAFQHDRAGIPPYKMLQVPAPKDFAMEKTDTHDFNRYAISYGLSVPFGEGPDIGLPSEFTIIDLLKPRALIGRVDYLDSKDAFD